MVNPLKGSIILIFRLKKGFSSFSSEPWHISKCFYTHTHARTHTHTFMHAHIAGLKKGVSVKNYS